MVYSRVLKKKNYKIKEQQNNHYSSYAMVGLRYDLKHFPGRNDGLKRSRYIDSDNDPASAKAFKVLKLTQLTFCASTAILLFSDICSQPGPLNQEDFGAPSFSIKATGLSIARLNIRSLLGTIDQLSIINNLAGLFLYFSEVITVTVTEKFDCIHHRHFYCRFPSLIMITR